MENEKTTEFDHIKTLAEVRMNCTGDSYETALREVREMVADGAWYDADRGWLWGNES